MKEYNPKIREKTEYELGDHKRRSRHYILHASCNRCRKLLGFTMNHIGEGIYCPSCLDSIRKEKEKT